MTVIATQSLKGDEAWRTEIARTGAWDEPAYCTLPPYQRLSPWTPDELSAAFAALRKIYSRARTQRIFRGGDGSLWPLLVDPFAPSFSRLVALGLDAAECGAWKDKSLIDALVADWRSFEGASFEISIFAGMSRAGIVCVHEPLRQRVAAALTDGEKPKNPDFALDLGMGSPVFLEVKLARGSARMKQERDWLTRFAMGSTQTARIPTNVMMLGSFAELQERDDGAWMRANIGRLVGIVEDTKILLSKGDNYPAVAVVEDCVRIEVKGPPDSTAGGGALGVILNSEREASRIARNLIADGATQIRRDHTGLILLDPGSGVDPEALGQEVERWFSAEGADYPNVAGVLLLSPEYCDNFRFAITRVTPHWRAGASLRLRESNAWDALAVGLSWRELRRAGVWDRLLTDAQ